MSQTHVPTRAEIDTRYTWNDASVFATIDDWSAELAALNAELADVLAWRGRLGEGPAVLAEALTAIYDFRGRADKVFVYAYLNESVDTSDQAATCRSLSLN
jgi:oligoendopeptidase F